MGGWAGWLLASFSSPPRFSSTWTMFVPVVSGENRQSEHIFVCVVFRNPLIMDISVFVWVLLFDTFLLDNLPHN